MEEQTLEYKEFEAEWSRLINLLAKAYIVLLGARNVGSAEADMICKLKKGKESDIDPNLVVFDFHSIRPEMDKVIKEIETLTEELGVELNIEKIFRTGDFRGVIMKYHRLSKVDKSFIRLKGE